MGRRGWHKLEVHRSFIGRILRAGRGRTAVPRTLRESRSLELPPVPVSTNEQEVDKPLDGDVGDQSMHAVDGVTFVKGGGTDMSTRQAEPENTRRDKTATASEKP